MVNSITQQKAKSKETGVSKIGGKGGKGAKKRIWPCVAVRERHKKGGGKQGFAVDKLKGHRKGMN